MGRLPLSGRGQTMNEEASKCTCWCQRVLDAIKMTKGSWECVCRDQIGRCEKVVWEKREAKTWMNFPDSAKLSTNSQGPIKLCLWSIRKTQRQQRGNLSPALQLSRARSRISLSIWVCLHSQWHKERILTQRRHSSSNLNFVKVLPGTENRKQEKRDRAWYC